MASVSGSVCSQCMRTLRRSLRLEKPQFSAPTPAHLRFLSTTPPQWHESAQRVSSDRNARSPVPTPSTGAATSDASAATTSSSTPSQASPDMSTAAMQRAIRENLSQSSGPSLAMRMAAGLRSAAPAATESYIIYGHSEALFKSCGRQADYTIPAEQRLSILTGKGPPKDAEGIDLGVPVPENGDRDGGLWWFDTIGLPPTFSTWSQVAFLHMYILTVRLRTISNQKNFQNYQRYLIEHFSHAAEDKMEVLHVMGSRGIRNKYLKDLFLQWRGIIAAYDEGLMKGDAMLASAVWRNVFRGSADVDWEKVAVVVAFIRRAIVLTEEYEIGALATELKDGNSLWRKSREGLVELVAKKHPLPTIEPEE